MLGLIAAITFLNVGGVPQETGQLPATRREIGSCDAGGGSMITEFSELRRDGSVLTEEMSVEDAFQLGPPSKVVELRWLSDGTPVRLAAPNGVLARVMPQRTCVVLILDGAVSVIDAGGLLMRSVPLGPGEPLWFEPPRSSQPDELGIVVRTPAGNRIVEVNITSGEVLSSR